jgi:hypothetical protein
LFRQQRAIDDVFPSVAGIGANFRFIERHFPNLVRPGHGDVQIATVDPQGPGTGEPGLQRRADKAIWHFAARGIGIETGKWKVRLLAGAGDGDNPLILQIDFAEQMIFGIGHVQHIADKCQALRVIKLGGGEIAIGFADAAGTDDGNDFAIERSDHDAVVVAIGDEQAAAGFVGQNFAGIAQRRLGGFVALQLKAHRLFVQQTVLAIVGQLLFDEAIERGEIDLATVRGDEIAFRIDHAQAGPTAATVTIPDFVIGVVHHRMFDFITHDGLANAFGIVLSIELARMHADDDDVIGIRLFQLFEFRQHVHAVDAAVGPEIEDDEFAAKVFQFDWRRRVEPFGAALQRRRRGAVGKWIFGRFIGLGRICCRHARLGQLADFGGVAGVRGSAAAERDDKKNGRKRQQSGRCWLSKCLKPHGMPGKIEVGWRAHSAVDCAALLWTILTHLTARLKEAGKSCLPMPPVQRVCSTVLVVIVKGGLSSCLQF